MRHCDRLCGREFPFRSVEDNLGIFPQNGWKLVRLGSTSQVNCKVTAVGFPSGQLPQWSVLVSFPSGRFPQTPPQWAVVSSPVVSVGQNSVGRSVSVGVGQFRSVSPVVSFPSGQFPQWSVSPVVGFPGGQCRSVSRVVSFPRGQFRSVSPVVSFPCGPFPQWSVSASLSRHDRGRSRAPL